MLTIIAKTSFHKRVFEIIQSVDRLEELVTVMDNDKFHEATSKLLVVEGDSIKKQLNWYDLDPPYIIPTSSFSKENLLALVFSSLGNHKRALQFLEQDTDLFKHLLIYANICRQKEIDHHLYNFALTNSMHNACIIQQYGICHARNTEEELKIQYQETIKNSENDEFLIYSVKHFTNFLIDIQNFSEAEKLINDLYHRAISDNARAALDIQLAIAMMQQLEMPFDTEKLNKIHELFEKSITFLESRNLKLNAGVLLIEASEIARFQEEFIKSIDYINKAIAYFKEENIPEFLGEAGFQKAILLYTWCKKGQPQYYKSAINAFQDALKIFKRDTHPQKFADIHHNMALIYSEIPVSSEEKPMWVAFCVSSFKEALAYYTVDKFPYEYAMISHNYATALINFPEAKLHNNLDKAFTLFEQALDIRTAESFPVERASTLLNQLELYWLLHNENSEAEVRRINEMHSKILSIKQLTNNRATLEKVEFHEKKLASL